MLNYSAIKIRRLFAVICTNQNVQIKCGTSRVTEQSQCILLFSVSCKQNPFANTCSVHSFVVKASPSMSKAQEHSNFNLTIAAYPSFWRGWKHCPPFLSLGSPCGSKICLPCLFIILLFNAYFYWVSLLLLLFVFATSWLYLWYSINVWYIL